MGGGGAKREGNGNAPPPQTPYRSQQPTPGHRQRKHPVTLQRQDQTDASAGKEPYISEKEPYIPAQEPCIPAKYRDGECSVSGRGDELRVVLEKCMSLRRQVRYLSLFLSFSLFLALSFSLSHAQEHAHAHICNTHTHTHTLSLSLSFSVSLCVSLSLTHTGVQAQVGAGRGPTDTRGEPQHCP